MPRSISNVGTTKRKIRRGAVRGIFPSEPPTCGSQAPRVAACAERPSGAPGRVPLGTDSRACRPAAHCPTFLSIRPHNIPQCSDPGNADPNFVSHLQGERIGWHNPCAGEQKAAVRKNIVAIKVFNQAREITLYRTYRNGSCKNSSAAALNLNTDLCRTAKRRGKHPNARAQRATSVIHLRLRQIKGILPLNITRTHVVADCVPEDFSFGTHQQHQFRLRHRPLRVPPYCNLPQMSNDSVCGRLKEEFRPLRVINAVVEISATGGFRLFHPGVAALEVRYPCRPNFLSPDRSEDFRFIQLFRSAVTRPAHHFLQIVCKILPRDPFVPGAVTFRIEMAVVLQHAASNRAIQPDR